MTQTQMLSNEEIMALSGQKTSTEGLFRIRINTELEDDAKNRLPVGTFVLPNPADRVSVVYADSVSIRPFVRGFWYGVYNAKNNRYDPRTTIVSNLSEEMPDTSGNIRCGKVDKSKLNELTEAEKLKQKQIRCYINLYGLVSANAKTKDGTNVAVTNVPVFIRGSGSSFMPLSEAVDVFTKQRKPMLSYNIKLTTKREKKGGNTYYVIIAEAQTNNDPIPLSPDAVEQLNVFRKIIDDENKTIMNINTKFRIGNIAKTVTDIADTHELADDLNDRLAVAVDFA